MQTSEAGQLGARAEWNRLQRGTATLTYQLALGRPELMPELTYTRQCVKAEIDAIIWYAATCGTVSWGMAAKPPASN